MPEKRFSFSLTKEEYHALKDTDMLKNYRAQYFGSQVTFAPFNNCFVFFAK